MSKPVQVIGSYLSPYVRKVLVFLHLKGIPYEIDPIVGFMGNERFAAISPVRRIPVLIDDRVTLCDSSVICQYLEDRYPTPALYPADVADRARARWLEEYADTRMGEVFIWRIFNQVAIEPFVFGNKTDPEALQRAVTEDLPDVLGYLEAQVPAEGFLFGALSIADVSVATFFRNLAFSRVPVDAARFPKTAAFVARVLATEGFAALVPFEDKQRKTPIPQAREALAATGAPIMAEVYGSSTARRGVLKI